MMRNVVLAAALVTLAIVFFPGTVALDVSAPAVAQTANASAESSPGSGLGPGAFHAEAAGPISIHSNDARANRHDQETLFEASAAPEAPASSDPEATLVTVGSFVGLGLLLALAKGGLLGGAGLPFFSRIATERVLENDARRRVYEMITQNPGATLSEIATTLQLGWGTTIYHVNRLEADRLVASERHRQFRRFFKNGSGIPVDSKGAVGELKNPTVQRIAHEILQRPGAAQFELCRAVGISAPLAHKHLERMAQAQLLTKQREWKSVKYFPTARLSELMVAAHVPTPAAPQTIELSAAVA